jgi:hypothetical protein
MTPLVIRLTRELLAEIGAVVPTGQPMVVSPSVV